MTLELISYKKKAGRIAIKIILLVLFMISWMLVVGGNNSAPLAIIYKWPFWAYFMAFLALIVTTSFLFGVSTLGLGIGKLIFTENSIIIQKAIARDVFPKSELSEIQVIPNYSKRVSVEKMGWVLSFTYKNQSYKFDFLMALKKKDELMGFIHRCS